MGFFSDIFSRSGRVARGQANQGMDKIEDATFDHAMGQTETGLAKLARAAAEAPESFEASGVTPASS